MWKSVNLNLSRSFHNPFFNREGVQPSLESIKMERMEKQSPELICMEGKKMGAINWGWGWRGWGFLSTVLKLFNKGLES